MPGLQYVSSIHTTAGELTLLFGLPGKETLFFPELYRSLACCWLIRWLTWWQGGRTVDAVNQRPLAERPLGRSETRDLQRFSTGGLVQIDVAHCELSEAGQRSVS